MESEWTDGELRLEVVKREKNEITVRVWQGGGPYTYLVNLNKRAFDTIRREVDKDDIISHVVAIHRKLLEIKAWCPGMDLSGFEDGSLALLTSHSSDNSHVGFITYNGGEKIELTSQKGHNRSWRGTRQEIKTIPRLVPKSEGLTGIELVKMDKVDDFWLRFTTPSGEIVSRPIGNSSAEDTDPVLLWARSEWARTHKGEASDA